ncbi:MAG: hypothetical protein FJW39_00885 [Acidobacteria bacterium]|nr:hypothetical protein [Acidobacteriota bacterium]
MALRINGEYLASEVLREEERLIRPQLREAMQDDEPRVVEQRVKEWARENVIERTVLRQEARKDPTPVPQDELDRMFHDVREQSPNQSGCLLPGTDEQVRGELEIRFRVERLLKSVTDKIGPPKGKDISDFYLKTKDQFTAPESIHAAHIVKNVGDGVDESEAGAAIEEALRELEAGAGFSELADRVSDCPGRGGDLGFFPRGEMVEEFDQVVFALQPGQRSGIFRTMFGYHIAQVYERKPAGLRSLHEVKDQISETLHQQKRQKAVEQFLDRLMSGAKVEDAE